MGLIAPLPENIVAKKSYNLFHVVMQAPVSSAYSQEKKWDASRLAMHGAYKCDKFLPSVEDPDDILVFLNHHFDLATRPGENPDEPIQNALRALAYAPSSATIEALKRFNLKEPLFICSICYIYQDKRPLQLQKAALLFLALIGEKWFNTHESIMEPDQMRSLCMDWAVTVDNLEHTEDVKKAALMVLLGMINSPHWRPYIVKEKWKLLEYFTSIPDDSQPLRRCIDNPELTHAIRSMENPTATTLWFVILWLKYKELIPEVQEQLDEITRETVQDDGGADLDICLSVMNSELEKAQSALVYHGAWSTEPAAKSLRVKINNIQQAKTTLVNLKTIS